MTPIRAKRNSKAPERFSSDEIKNDSPNNGSNSSLSDKSGSITKIKLKPLIREPLKVKLPRLKRLQPMQFHSQAKESKKTINNNNNNNSSSGINGIFTSKIKLPHRKKLSVIPRYHDEPTTITTNQLNELEHSSDERRESNINSNNSRSSDLNLSSSQKSDDDISLNDDKDEPISKHNESMAETDKSLDEADASFSSSASDERGMQIIVERNLEPTNSSGIRCPCGVDDDLGVMLECEKCLTWQHGHCVNVGPVEDAYENYVCAYCTLPQGKHHESLLNLVVDDKFQSKFAMLEEFMKLKSESTGVAEENQINFTTEELEVATSDLNRVASSLRVKWRILTAEDYNAELKIWQNPIWSDDPQENRKQQQLQTVRFVGDIYKSNLKLNICNMLNKMHKRCQLTRFQISCLEKQGQDAQSRLDKILASLDEISRVVEEFSDSLKQN